MAVLRILPVLFFVFFPFAHASLTWENPSQEFQCHPEDLELTVNFAFKNTGEQSVTISKVTSSCGCTTANLQKKTYLPGESGDLSAKFTFGGRQGAQSKTITVVTDDKETTQLSFKCMITDEPLTLVPSFVFWRVGGQVETKQVKITMAKDPKIHIVAVASSNPRVSANLATPREDGTLGVDIRPVDTSKSETAEIFIQTDYPPEGPKAYTVQVRIK